MSGNEKPVVARNTGSRGRAPFKESFGAVTRQQKIVQPFIGKLAPTNAEDWKAYARSVVRNGTEWGAK